MGNLDDILDTFIDQDTPLLNKNLSSGVATIQLKRAPQYIDSTIQSASRSFIPGLLYLGYDVCSPEEMYYFMTQKGKGKKNLDVSQTDFYLIKFKFSFNGEPLNRLLFLPFCRDAGYVKLRGTDYLVQPTLNDIIFSIKDESIFVRLQRDKFTFKRISHGFFIDGERVEMSSVIWSKIHKLLNDRATAGVTCAMHYLLVKYGFTQTFQVFADTTPIIGMGNEINFEKYPKDKWVILSTSHQYPRYLRLKKMHPTQLRIAIPRDKWESKPILKNLVGGFYYIVDHFPNRVTKAQWVDNTRLWKMLLGKLIFTDMHEGVMMEKIDEHIASTDDYMDLHVIRQLRTIGYELKDFYQLLALLIEKFPEWVALSSDHITSLYGKELNVNGFVLYPITKAIFETTFQLTNRLNIRGQLNYKDVEEIFNRNLRPELIYRITTSNNREVSVMDASNDNKALRLTTMMLPYSSASTSKSDFNLNDPSVRVHPSIAEFAGYCNPPKSYPDGRARLNHCAIVDEHFNLIRNPDFIPVTDEALQLLKSGDFLRLMREDHDIS